jgi:hypothetical protein
MLQRQFINAQFRDGTMTDQNQLANALLTKPEIADELIMAYGNQGEGNKMGVMQMLTQGMGRVGSVDKDYKIQGSDEIIWFLQGLQGRTIPIADQSIPAPAANVGQNFAEFIVPLAGKYFTPGDVVRFPNNSLCRVQAEPYKNGDNWCYTFAIMGANPNEFIPANALAVGRELAMGTTAFEEYSEGGGMKETTPMAFRNQMSIQRKSYSMSGGAKTDVVVFSVKGRDSNGNEKTSNSWMYKKQHDLYYQWVCEQEYALWFNKYNRLQDGTFAVKGMNGRPVKTGSGIEEQIIGTNQIVTDQLTEELLRYMILDINKNGMSAENKKLLLVTGLGGIDEFDRAMKRALGGLGGFVVDTTFIDKKGGNKLGFGSQFTTYRGLLGTEITVVHHPMFDDITRFPNVDPITGFTDQSYKMYFLDFSDYGGAPNIQMIFKGAHGEDRRLLSWFTAGATEPNFNGNSGVKAMMRSNGLDGFSMYMLSESMVLIKNPLGCGMITIRRPGLNGLNP